MSDEAGITIKSTPIRHFLQRAYCGICGEELCFTGHWFTYLCTTWEHRCGCPAPRWLDVAYPTQAWEETPRE